MNVTITPGKLQGQVNIIPSKSHGHRLLMAAYLAGQKDMVSVNINSVDIEATTACMEELMAKDAPCLDCQESGSTLRFLVPVTMAMKEEASFMRKGRLADRPLSPLKEEMEKHGCTFEEIGEDRTLVIKGKMSGGTFNIAGNVSSQFITGLLFALPLLEEGGKIVVTKPLESKPYVDLTLDVLKKASIKVEVTEDDETIVFKTTGGQAYDLRAAYENAGGSLPAEGDWSNGAFFLVAKALGSDVETLGLNPDSKQGDKEIVDILAAFKAEPEKLHVVDASNIPDLIPIVCVAAYGLGVDLDVVNAGRLRIKESDRLNSVRVCLELLGCPVTELPEGIEVRARSGQMEETADVIEADSFNDHRIAMAMAIAATCADKPVKILRAQAVNKSYPAFYDEFERMGGKIEREN